MLSLNSYTSQINFSFKIDLMKNNHNSSIMFDYGRLDFERGDKRMIYTFYIFYYLNAEAQEQFRVFN